jgi:tetratricopeptide (TPR) repeat protein
MATDRAISEPFEQTARQTAEVGALVRMLGASEGTSSLSIGICNSPALRNYIIEKVKADRCAIELVKITEEVEDIFDFVRHKVNNDKPAGIFIVDMEKVLPSGRGDYKILRTLNATRELWRSNFHCPVVFWVAEYAATLLSIHARDFWSWLSHSFEFVSEQATAMKGIADSYSGNIMLAGNLDIDQKHFRIAELEQRIEDAGDPPKSELIQHLLTWLNELAYIYSCIGELDKAERIIHKSLDINESLGRSEGMASDYGNLGLVYETRGELDKAEEMFDKVKEIHEKRSDREGLAKDYGHLGLVYLTMGELEKAEGMFRKGLEIDEKLGRLDGMANNYGNLGLIYQTKGDLDKAEKMHLKSLEIEKKLGRLEGMASEYGNVGLIYQTKGDLNKAEKMHLKSLEIEKKLGRLQGMASDYGNLGNVYQIRGDLEKAEEMFRKSLAISEPAGMMAVTANQYGNLGLIYGTKGDLDKAEEMFRKSLAISEPAGMIESSANTYANLGSLYKQRGQIDKARDYWAKAVALYTKIGIPDMVKKVQAWIDES